MCRKYEHMPYFSVIKQTVFFGNIFSDDERSFILENLEQITYSADSIVFSQGEIPSFLYIIIDGTVELIQSDVQGKYNSLQKMSVWVVAFL